MWMFNIFSAFNFFFSCLIPNFSLPLHPKCVKPHISDIMKIKDILGALEEFAPLALQDGYDNAGLQIGLAEDAEATGVLLSLDVTEEVVNEAVLRGCNLIVSHHPLMFHPVKTFNGKTYVERAILKAIKNDVAVYAAHTNLDVAYGGVNFKIAEKLGLQNVEWLSERESYVSGEKTLMAGDGIIAVLRFEKGIYGTSKGGVPSEVTACQQCLSQDHQACGTLWRLWRIAHSPGHREGGGRVHHG